MSKELLRQARINYPEAEAKMIEHAVDFAKLKHQGQKRDSGKPYVTHPLSVGEILIEWQMDSPSVVAGILHDTIEDTDTTYAEIKSEFNEEIAKLVAGLTKIGQARSGMRDLSEYMPQTSDNLSKLLLASSQDIRVIIIKLADRLHNLRELNFKSPAKQKKIARESLEVFASIADQIGMGRVRMQIEEISFSYLDPKRYKHLHNLLRKRLGRSTRKLGIVRAEVEQALKTAGLKFEINGRVKSVYSLHKKMLRKDENIDDIYDLMALRVIVETKEDCYKVLGILHSLYQPMVQRIKDYIAVPKSNGYQSLHTTVITPHKQIVEFQIRTEAMHEYAERGLAASFHYHQQKSSKNYLKRAKISDLPPNLQWIAQLQEVASQIKSGNPIDKDQLAIDLFRDRIFVYSPKGDIFSLPEGALPLDFAYLVHSGVAAHAHTFLVNNKISPFDRPLENGDLVEVKTRASVTPSPDWAELVSTSHAKAKLRAQLKKLGLTVAKTDKNKVTKPAKNIKKAR